MIIPLLDITATDERFHNRTVLFHEEMRNYPVHDSQVGLTSVILVERTQADTFSERPNASKNEDSAASFKKFFYW
jgi:hypothetical protein